MAKPINDSESYAAVMQRRSDLLALLAENTAKLKDQSPNDIDMNNPKVPPYRYQEFPKMLHHHQHKDPSSITDQVTTKAHNVRLPEHAVPVPELRHLSVIVHNREEEEEALGNGFELEPPPPSWAGKQGDASPVYTLTPEEERAALVERLRQLGQEIPDTDTEETEETDDAYVTETSEAAEAAAGQVEAAKAPRRKTKRRAK